MATHHQRHHDHREAYLFGIPLGILVSTRRSRLELVLPFINEGRHSIAAEYA